MLLPDVSVLVYAFRRESAHHAAMREWLDGLVNGRSRFAVSELVLSGFLRVVTNRRIYRTPTSTADALVFVDAVVAAPHCETIRPGPGHLGAFTDLCRRVDASGNDVADAYLAALAIESGSEWVTCDRGFARFPGLRWRHPLDP